MRGRVVSVTAALFAKKMYQIGACVEGREWIEKGNHSDFRATWTVCPGGEFLCWLVVRLMGVEGTKAPVAIAKKVSEHYLDEPLLKDIVGLCEAVVAGKSKDTKGLQTLAYDATAIVLSTRKQSAEALLTASY